MPSPLAMARPCAECPWRRDVAPGKFPPQRFVQLARTVEEGGKLFACHLTPNGEERACAGYCAGDGPRNLLLRLAHSMGQINIGAIQAEAAKFDLFKTYQEMAEANGCRRLPDGSYAPATTTTARRRARHA